MTQSLRNNQREKVFYVTSLFPVITQTFVSRELIELERRGIEIEVISLRNSPHAIGEEELPRAKVTYIPYFFSMRVALSSIRTMAKYRWRIIRETGYIIRKLARKPLRVMKFISILPKSLFLIEYFSRERACHIHAHWATVPTTCAFFIHRISGIPFSFSAHAWDIFVEGNELLLREKLHEADMIFTCTEYNRKALLGFGGEEEKISLMYHGLEMARYKYSDPEHTGAPLIVAGGSLIPQKGLDVLVESLDKLKKEGVCCAVRIFGEGKEKRKLVSLVQSYHLESEVEFTGNLPHKLVIDMLEHADIFVMPSVSAKKKFIDGLPNVVAEAMACGVAVIASRISGIPELLEDGREGLLVPAGDAEALAAAITRLLGDPELRRTLARNARTKVLENFDIARNITPLHEYLLSSMDQNLRAARDGGNTCAG